MLHNEVTHFITIEKLKSGNTQMIMEYSSKATIEEILHTIKINLEYNVKTNKTFN